MLWLPIITGQRAPSTLFFFFRFGFVNLVFVFLDVFFVVVLVLFYVFAFSWSEVLVRLRGFANIYTRKAALAAVQPS